MIGNKNVIAYNFRVVHLFMHIKLPVQNVSNEPNYIFKSNLLKKPIAKRISRKLPLS